MVRYFCILCFSVFIISCGSTVEENADQINTQNFFDKFSSFGFNNTITDTALQNFGDTENIQKDVLLQLVPDTALSLVILSKPFEAYPAGKIQSDELFYTIIKFTQAKKNKLAVFVFDKNKKFLTSMPIFNNGKKDYVYSLSVTSEPTFIINREKEVKNEPSLYTKDGYAYSKQAKGFIKVMEDGNEDEEKMNEIINPIDTVAANNLYSGEYSSGKTNIISVKDGRTANSYIFFMHFDKGDCSGELKGNLQMTDATHGIFTETGGPCVIDFTFSKTTVKVKEQGNCGNHRGIDCLIDFSFKKQKETVAKEKK